MTASPYSALRERVRHVNQELVRAGLVVLSFGNASAVDRESGMVAIKPSGSEYVHLAPADIVVLALEDGRVIDGGLRPSSDTPTHLYLYKSFPTVGGIVHTHSVHATSWAQARRPIPCLGTTHADHFRGPVPVTRALTQAEVVSDYELNTGRLIVERFELDDLDASEIPGCLDASHGPFVWGETPEMALENAIALEYAATMAMHTLTLAPDAPEIDGALRDRHFRRKHGSDAYYGQRR